MKRHIASFELRTDGWSANRIAFRMERTNRDLDTSAGLDSGPVIGISTETSPLLASGVS
jgi:hypothetical protein